MKQAFLLSEQGVVNIYFFRDANPRVQLLIDLGIPNFTVFSIDLPIPEHDPKNTERIFREGVNLLLEQIKVFLAQTEFQNDGGVIGTIAKCVGKTEIDFYSTEPMQGYEILFPLTNEFYHNVTQRLVKQKVAAKRSETVKASDVWSGPQTGSRYSSPNEGKMLKELEQKGRLKKRDQQAVEDAKKIIDRYKQVVYKNTPGPMYVMMYDRYGKPRGVGRVTNHGVTKWADKTAAGWSENNWWIKNDGQIIRLDPEELHAERAQRILRLGDIGMREIYHQAFEQGWVRAALNGGVMFLQAGKWDRKRLNLAQDFLLHQGPSGIHSITIEDEEATQSQYGVTFDEFVTARNAGELFRKFGSEPKTANIEGIDESLKRVKSPGLLQLRKKVEKNPKYLVAYKSIFASATRVRPGVDRTVTGMGVGSFVKACEQSERDPEGDYDHPFVVFEVPTDAKIYKYKSDSGLWMFHVNTSDVPKVAFEGNLGNESDIEATKSFKSDEFKTATVEGIDESLKKVKSPGLLQLKEKMTKNPKYLVSFRSFFDADTSVQPSHRKVTGMGIGSFVKGLKRYGKDTWTGTWPFLVFEVPTDAKIYKYKADKGSWIFHVNTSDVPKVVFEGAIENESDIEALKSFVTKSDESKTASVPMNARGWWLNPTGAAIPLKSSEEHWEKAYELLGADDPDSTRNRQQYLDTLFQEGWIRVSYYDRTVYFDTFNWDKSKMRTAQDFTMTLKGIDEVVMEEDWRTSTKAATVPLDTFLTISNPNLIWRYGKLAAQSKGLKGTR